MMTIKNFAEAKQFLHSHIPRGVKQKFPGALGLERTRYFLKLIGNPQNKIKIIHIAGTSGKGSTAYLTSLILKALGFKVGLHISPHLLDLRERFQINNQLINKEKFCFYLNKLIPYIEKVKKSRFGPPTYFEVLVVLAFLIFFEEKVDYAVIETGLGGLYDATNTITNKNKVVILTKIGFDHKKILGKKLKEIAFHKASIIQKQNTTFSIWQKPSARKIINQIAKEKQAKVYYLKKDTNFKNIIINKTKVIFDFNFLDTRIKKLEIGLTGSFQAENSSLSLAAVLFLSRRDGFTLNIEKIKKALKKAYFPGRFETFEVNKKTLIIDGAHNPQKMANFIKNLKKIYPQKKFVFLIAFKKGKDYHKMLKYIIPLASQIIITQFFINNQDLIHLSEEPETIVKILQKENFYQYQVIKDLKNALKFALDQKDQPIVAAGSLYLISEIYSNLKTIDKLFLRPQ